MRVFFRKIKDAWKTIPVMQHRVCFPRWYIPLFSSFLFFCKFLSTNIHPSFRLHFAWFYGCPHMLTYHKFATKWNKITRGGRPYCRIAQLNCSTNHNKLHKTKKKRIFIAMRVFFRKITDAWKTIPVMQHRVCFSRWYIAFLSSFLFFPNFSLLRFIHLFVHILCGFTDALACSRTINSLPNETKSREGDVHTVA